jgi:hypothetical protein
MTITSLSDEWKNWLASAPPTGWECDALEFVFESNEVIRIANKLDTRPTQKLKHESGNDATYTQADFTISRPNKALTTEYTLDITMVPLQNNLVTAIANATGVELQSEIRCAYRIYLLPEYSNRPAIAPAFKLRVQSIVLAKGAIAISVVPITLSRKRSGDAYTIDQFPGLGRY